MHRRRLLRLACGLAALPSSAVATLRADEPYVVPAEPPSAGDDSHQALRAFQQRLLARYGRYRDVPLDEKAEYFEWEMFRYHLTSFGQITGRAVMSDRPGVRPTSVPSRDTSTWNGSVMAALSFKYAVTKEPETLRRLAELVRGMHLFFEVMERPGIMARAVHPERWPNDEHGPMKEYRAADGRTWWYVDDPAKGGFNQIAGGYAALMMFAYADLPPDVQRLAHRDMTHMVLHLVGYRWKATDKENRPTTYGDLTPIVATVGVPFNAQIAYEIVALGHAFPPDDPTHAEIIHDEFHRLRTEHHCYYEDPRRHLICPQRVGGSPLIKGMNDRNHVTNAAFVGLMLELDEARRTKRPVDREFMYQLGRTMVHSMELLYDQRNALCTFMWAGLTREASLLQVFAPDDWRSHQLRTAAALVDGVEQLRRFRLDRWWIGGRYEEKPDLQWCDAFRPDDSQWKVSPYMTFVATGPYFNEHYCAMDFLYAYWVARYFRLQDHVTLRQAHAAVLRPTPGLRTWPLEGVGP